MTPTSQTWGNLPTATCQLRLKYSLVLPHPLTNYLTFHHSHNPIWSYHTYHKTTPLSSLLQTTILKSPHYSSLPLLQILINTAMGGLIRYEFDITSHPIIIYIPVLDISITLDNLILFSFSMVCPYINSTVNTHHPPLPTKKPPPKSKNTKNVQNGRITTEFPRWLLHLSVCLTRCGPSRVLSLVHMTTKSPAVKTCLIMTV